MNIEELDLEKAKEIIISWAKSKQFITRVYIFGSRVSGISKKTGKPVRPDSDLDVAIDFEPFRNEDQFTTWIADSSEWSKELAKLLGFTKDEYLDLQHCNASHVAKYLEDSSVIIYTKEST